MLNKTNILRLIGIGSLCLFLFGCSEESFLVQENTSDVIMEDTSEIALAEETKFSKKENEAKDSFDEQILSGEIQSGDGERAENQISQKEIAVHICGAVNRPGVYYLVENQRLYEGIAKAGGFREDADEDYLNQALILEDGMKIVVPTIEETAVEPGNKESENILSSKEAEKSALEEGYLHKKEDAGKASEQKSKIDLNTADETLLCTLPGIGESRARSIIAYRQEQGPFRSPEDVMKVSGIKEAAYEKIREYIMVSE